MSSDSDSTVSSSDCLPFFDYLPDHIIIRTFNFVDVTRERMRLELISPRFQALLALQSAWDTCRTLSLTFEEESANRREREFLRINESRFAFDKVPCALTVLLSRARQMDRVDAKVTIDEDRSQGEPAVCSLMGELLKSGLNIKTFNFTGYGCANFPILFINVFNESLQSLKICMDYSGTTTQTMLRNMIGSCKKLKKFSADFDEFYPNFNDSDLILALEDKQLESLDLRNSFKVSTDAILQVLAGKKVSELALVGCARVNWLKVSRGFSKEQKNSIGCLCWEFGTESASEECLLTFAQQFPNVTVCFFLRFDNVFTGHSVKASLDQLLAYYRESPIEKSKHIYLLYQVEMTDVYNQCHSSLICEERSSVFDDCHCGTVLKLFDITHFYRIVDGKLTVHLCFAQIGTHSSVSTASLFSTSSNNSMTDSYDDTYSDSQADLDDGEHLESEDGNHSSAESGNGQF